MRPRRAAWLGAIMLAAALTGAARAQPVDADELAFWEAVQQSGRPAEYRAYLETYPNGHFAALARLRAGVAPPPGPTTTARAPVAGAWLRPAAPQVQLVQGVVLDLDATALRNGSNHRLAVMPAEAPDAIADSAEFLANSTPIGMGRLHLTIPAGPPGGDEVRLYYIPPYESAYRVGARAPVVVQPGIPGATLPRALVREAQRMGPIRFEAAHRDRPLLVQAAFLRVRPQTEWNLAWFPGRTLQEVRSQLMVVSIGLPGAARDEYGAQGELICTLRADTATLNRVAALQVGDPVLVRGIPVLWSDAAGSEPLLLDRCSLQS